VGFNNGLETKMNVQSKKLYVLLWIFCVIGSWSILPFSLYVGILPPAVSFLQIFLLATLQAALFFAVICFLSFKLVPKTDLHPFTIKKPQIYFGVFCGVILGLIIYILDRTVPIWTGALASIYGAVNEEVLLRLFLLTFVYFLCRKLFTVTNKNRLIFLWIASFIAALVFGIGHLPAAFKLGQQASFEIFRILLLNGLPGLVFGWLYWSRSLWTAMIAHLTADLMIYVVLR
jgi:membrane protease YdiL (CAAX protease family)